METCARIIFIGLVILLLPYLAAAQTADQIRSLQDVLDKLYSDMMPKCSQLIGVGRAIAGFAATWYIASRVWGHIARAEPVDFYPLFRPFVLGFAILIFPSVIDLINAVMQPTVTGTRQMVSNSDAAIVKLLAMKQEAIQKTTYWQMYVGPTGNGDREKWYKYYYGESPENPLSGISHNIQFAFARFQYNFRNTVKQWMSEVLQVLFEAAALCINTIRTFYLIILAMLGPLALGLSVFDGFQHTLKVWLARYINVFLWLPICNIFGSLIGTIQENMLKVDLQKIASNGDTFFSATDTAYLVFLFIGIIGYFTVPAVANYIINAGGGNALLSRVAGMPGTAIRATTGMPGRSIGM